MVQVKDIKSALDHSQFKKTNFKALMFYTRIAAIVTYGGTCLWRNQEILNCFLRMIGTGFACPTIVNDRDFFQFNEPDDFPVEIMHIDYKTPNNVETGGRMDAVLFILLNTARKRWREKARCRGMFTDFGDFGLPKSPWERAFLDVC